MISSIGPYDVELQARAFVEIISKMPTKEREAFPSVLLVKRFNQVLELSKEVTPRVDARLLPCQIAIDDDYTVVETVRHTDLQVFALQIACTLPTVVQP